MSVVLLSNRSCTVTSVYSGNNLISDLRKLSRSRASSPSHTRSRTASLSLSQKPRDILKSPDTPLNSKKASSPCVVDGNVAAIANACDRSVSRQERVMLALRKVESEIDDRLRSRELIGQVTDRKAVDRVRIKARRVTFTWQRGIKIGQFDV